MKKKTFRLNELSGMQITILAFLRQFPYATRQGLSEQVFSKRDYNGSYLDKQIRKLESFDLVLRLWTGLRTWAYSISPAGIKLCSLITKDDWRKFQKPLEENFRFRLNSDIVFKKIAEKQIPRNYPVEHTELCLKVWKLLNSKYKPGDLFFTDLLGPSEKKKLKASWMFEDDNKKFANATLDREYKDRAKTMQSTPDFYYGFTETNGNFWAKAIEVEKSFASKDRLYKKIKKCYLDQFFFYQVIFIFEDLDSLETYRKGLSKEFLEGRYMPVGVKNDSMHDYSKAHLSGTQISFVEKNFFFSTLAEFPKKKTLRGADFEN